MSAPEILVGRAGARGGRRPAERGPLHWIGDVLAADSVLLPSLAALALLVILAADQGGYPQTHWAPIGIVLIALLAIAVGLVGLRRAHTPLPVRVALAALAAYTALSFLSILWAKVTGDAWEGADRTLVYLVLFALFSIWRRPGTSAAMLLGAWVLAITGLAVYTALHVDAAASNAVSLRALLPEGRLLSPSGYPNANAAMWMMAAFPALVLASLRAIPAVARGALAGCVVVLAGVALYSQSRGSVYSTPIVLLLAFVLLPGRVRTFATLLPVAIGVGAVVAPVLHLDEVVASGRAAGAAAGGATLAVLLSAALVALVVGVGATIERRSRLSSRAQAVVHRGVALGGLALLVALVAGGLVALGNPVARVEAEWATFTSAKGYAANEAGTSRLIGGLGSQRADIYRVAWHEFATHPLLGIGADNFAVPYLRLRHSNQTPHYPHSVELRTLAQTGAIGAIVAIVGLLAAGAAAFGAMRRSDPLARGVAAGALTGFVYWAVHGSFDWFFEYAGLGGAAFMLLGLACSLAPAESARITVSARSVPRRPAAGRAAAPALAALACAVAALAAGAALAAPWLSRMEVQSAARVWPTAPRAAYASLREAASLNPLSDEPYVIAGTIALRLGELPRAARQFGLALGRTPEESYATLERGAIASARGDQPRAIAFLSRAVALDPRYPISREALAAVRAGHRIDIQALNRSILGEAEDFS
ncbi:MAG: O-antigen ligase family protein [Solirubrobacteraceae bacterium]